MTALRLIALTSLAALTALVVLATPGVAHTALESAVPGIGAEVSTVDIVTLTYGKPMQEGSDPAIRIIAPDDTVVAEGDAEIDSSLTSISWQVGTTLPGDGQYTVEWAITAADGDDQSSRYVFTYVGSGTEFVSQSSPVTAGGADDADGTPIIPMLLVASAAAALAGGLLVFSRGLRS